MPEPNQHDEVYHHRLREIANDYSARMISIGKENMHQASVFAGRLNAYVFVAHAAIVSLALGSLTVADPFFPALATKLYFSVSSLALVLLAVDMAITTALLRKSAASYFQQSEQTLKAAAEDPPRLLTSENETQESADGDNRTDEGEEALPERLLWIANTASIALVLELIVGIILVWSI